MKIETLTFPVRRIGEGSERITVKSATPQVSVKVEPRSSPLLCTAMRTTMKTIMFLPDRWAEKNRYSIEVVVSMPSRQSDTKNYYGCEPAVPPPRRDGRKLNNDDAAARGRTNDKVMAPSRVVLSGNGDDDKMELPSSCCCGE